MAGTAATIVSGAVAERIKYRSFLVFSFVLVAVIYTIPGHWLWGGGWLSQKGCFDFAGSTVVIAVLGLMLTDLPYMYGVALSASFAVLVVMLASVSLLPALLSYLGPRVDRLRIPLLGRSLRRAEESGR